MNITLDMRKAEDSQLAGIQASVTDPGRLLGHEFRLVPPETLPEEQW
jgi:hypothetical protein